jgi:hypothetical protein
MMGLFAMPALRAAVNPAGIPSVRGAAANGGTRVRPRTGWMLDMLAMMGVAAAGRLPDGMTEPEMQFIEKRIND